MKQEHKIMDLLIAANRQLAETNEKLITAHTSTINLLEKTTHENEQLYQVCQQVHKWLLKEKNPTKKERHWIRKIQKMVIKRSI